MSRFFATGDTDSDSAGESSEDEQQQQKPVVVTKRPQYTFSDDDDDEKRVVRSLKDKRYDELKELIHTVKNSQKIKDVAKVQTGFETLQKAFVKAKAVVEKEGTTPTFYIRALVEMEDFINQLWEDKEAKAKLSKINARALASLKQKTRKYNKDFEARISDYRLNPVVSEDEAAAEEQRESEADEEEEEELLEKEVAPEDKELEEAGDSGSDSEWSSMSSDTTSSSSEEEGEKGLFHYTAEYFLKKTKGGKDEGKIRKSRETKRKERETEKALDIDDGEWETIQRKPTKVLNRQELKKMLFGKEVDEIDHNIIKEKRDEIISVRGKKTMDRNTSIDNLKLLLQFSQEAKLGPGMEVLLLVDIISTIYEIPSAASCMKDDLWESCTQYMNQLMTLLEDNSAMVLSSTISDEEVNFIVSDKPYMIQGSILTLIERLDDEFTKILQATDAHSTDFVTKLQGEAKVTQQICRVQEYLVNKHKDSRPELLCRIYMRRIDHLYYKIDRRVVKKAKKAGAEEEEEEGVADEGAEEVESGENSVSVMARLTKHIYNYQVVDNDRIRIRAVLCHVYHHALHDNWAQARDLMMMSHLQENIQFADVPTQILYNRALVQLGMCAFRHGMIKDAHDALMDIQSSGRSKELLAQGLVVRHDRTVEQEKIERRRQSPFHMHINLELMECVYLTSAMLLEIPYMAAAETEGRRRLISKSFHHQLKYHNKQPLIGPPESMREHVVAAAHAMRKGNWKKCNDYILSIKAWDLFINVDQLKELLMRKIQEESLRTYIFTYAETYNSLSLERLAEMFELPLQSVHSIVSKMIFKEEFLASLDEPTQMVIMHHAKPNKLQCHAFLLADKIGTLSDHNEELMKMKHAGPWTHSGGITGGQGGRSGNFRQNQDGGRSGNFRQNQDGGRSGNYRQNQDGGRSGNFRQNQDGGRSGNFRQNQDGGRSGNFRQNQGSWAGKSRNRQMRN